MSPRLPAEWEPQDGVLLAWPHAATDWAETLDEVLPVYLQLTAEIAAREQVLIVTPEPDQVHRQLRIADIDLQRICVSEQPTNDTWCRDFGPLTVYHQNKPELLDFGFNAWGLKFAADLDNQVNRRLHAAGCFGQTPMHTEGLILEGGSLESDGCGTLLTTSQCLLNANRNPHLDRGQLESLLCERFGLRKILWLHHGWLAGDDTDSHIDTLARLAPEQTIVHLSCEDPGDEHYAALQAMATELAELRDADNRPFRLLPLPWPQAIHVGQRRVPATYANFLVINDAVLVPTYADPADTEALKVIGEAFPGRDIVGIDARPLIAQGGSLHCLTMQLPVGVLP